MKTETGSVLILSQDKYYVKNLAGSLGNRIANIADQIARKHSYGAIPHIGAGILASEAMSRNFRVSIAGLYDQNILKEAKDYDVVMISAMDPAINQARDIVRRLTGSHKNLVLGGVGITAVGAEIMQEFPQVTVVHGEAEGQIGQLLDNLKNKGQIESSYRRTHPVQLEESSNEPYIDPRYSFRKLPLFARTPLKAFEITRGCSQACDFCVTALQPRTIKPLEVLKTEIKAVHPKWPEVLFFIDQNIFSAPKEYLHELFEYVNALGVYWIGEGTILDGFKDDKLMRLMGKNCLSFLVGLEDMFNKVRGSKIKNELQKDFAYYARTLQGYGMPIIWSIIFGTDEQEPHHYIETAEKVLELGVTVTSHMLTPRAGTPKYNQILRENRLLKNDTRLRDMRYHAVHKPQKMTYEDFLGGFIWFKNTVFSPQNVANRFICNLNASGPKYALGLSIQDSVSMFGTKRVNEMYPKMAQEFQMRYQTASRIKVIEELT